MDGRSVSDFDAPLEYSVVEDKDKGMKNNLTAKDIMNPDVMSVQIRQPA